MKLKSGLTSVTFRKLTAEKIIGLASESGLAGIEWGGDVHVPPDNISNAEKIGELTRNAGLEVLSYGSYFYAFPGYDAATSKAVLDTASALGAPNVRIWAGNTDAAKLSDADFGAMAASLERFAKEAAAYGITVSVEYHPNTLTDNIESTLRMLDRVKGPNFFTYFQPDARVTFEQNLNALKQIASRVLNLHVFQLNAQCERCALSEGRTVWMPYLHAFAKNGNRAEGACILEFVKDDSPDQFKSDAAALNCWLNELDQHLENKKINEGNCGVL